MSASITYTIPTDVTTPLTVASAFGPINQLRDALVSHLNGEDSTISGIPAHRATAIRQGALSVASTLDSTLSNPVLQSTYNDGLASAWYQLIGANGGAGWAGRLATFIGSSGNLTAMLALLQQHSHLDSTHGGLLTQAATHQSADTDGSAIALHHTLGTGAFQAAAGNHTHSGYESTSNKGAVSGYAPLDSSTLLPVAYIPSTIARVTDLSSYVPTSQKGAASGVASLDGSSKLTASQIPTTVALIASTSPIGHVHGAGSEVQITTAGIADFAVVGGTGAGSKVALGTLRLGNLADGYVTPNSLLTVLVQGYSYYNSAQTAYYTVSGVSTSTPLPTAGNQAYNLLYSDDSGTLGWKQGIGVPTSPAKPMPDINTKPLAWVGPLTSTTTTITSGLITDARQSPTSAPAIASAGSPDLSAKPFFTYHTDGTLTQEMDLFTWLDGTTSTAPDATNLATKRIDPTRITTAVGGGTLADALRSAVSPNIVGAIVAATTTTMRVVANAGNQSIFLSTGTIWSVATADVVSSAAPAGAAGQRYLIATLISGGTFTTRLSATNNPGAGTELLLAIIPWDGGALQTAGMDLTPITGIISSYGYQPTVINIQSAGGALSNAIVYPTYQAIPSMGTSTVNFPQAMRYTAHFEAYLTAPAASVPTTLINMALNGTVTGYPAALGGSPASFSVTVKSMVQGTINAGPNVFTLLATQTAGNAMTVQSAQLVVEFYK